MSKNKKDKIDKYIVNEKYIKELSDKKEQLMKENEKDRTNENIKKVEESKKEKIKNKDIKIPKFVTFLFLVLIIFLSSLVTSFFITNQIEKGLTNLSKDIIDIGLDEFKIENGKLTSDYFEDKVKLNEEKYYLLINTEEKLSTKDLKDNIGNILIDKNQAIISLNEDVEVFYIDFNYLNIDLDIKDIENKQVIEKVMHTIFLLILFIAFVFNLLFTLGISLVIFALEKIRKINITYLTILILTTMFSSSFFVLGLVSINLYAILVSLSVLIVLEIYIIKSKNRENEIKN